MRAGLGMKSQDFSEGEAVVILLTVLKRCYM
jgi:hypothetical protein